MGSEQVSKLKFIIYLKIYDILYFQFFKTKGKYHEQKVFRQNQGKSNRAVFSRCQRERSREQIQRFKNDGLYVDEGSQEKAKARDSRYEEA